MIKSLIPSFICVLAFYGQGLASSLAVGSHDVTFTVPEGYVEAAGEEYTPLRATFQHMMPPTLTVAALLVEREQSGGRTGGIDLFEDFVVISYSPDMGDRLLAGSEKERLFNQTRNGLATQQGKTPGIVTPTTENLAGSNGSLIPGRFFLVEETPDRLSIASILDQDLGGMHIHTMASLSSVQYLNGLLFFVYQYRSVDSPEQFARFVNDALSAYREFAFASDTVAPERPMRAASLTPDRSQGVSLKTGLLLGLGVLTLLTGWRRIRVKKD